MGGGRGGALLRILRAALSSQRGRRELHSRGIGDRLCGIMLGRGHSRFATTLALLLLRLMQEYPVVTPGFRAALAVAAAAEKDPTAAAELAAVVAVLGEWTDAPSA